MRIRDIAAVGSDQVWVVGGDQIRATTDGGATWTAQQHDGSGAFRAVHFIDANNGWIAGQKLHRTTNGGATWTAQSLDQEGFCDVHFINSTVDWLVGREGVILKTSTGGN